MRSRNKRRLDAIVFFAVLAAAVLMTVAGVRTGDLATVCVAVGGLYGAWTGNHRTPPTPDTEPPAADPGTPPTTHHTAPDTDQP
ncbi:hypothetical protein OG871_39100 [Kitasatospora sp. NBC_00374]|uniref:hypothetical protein n=1 Tax=Kitasatospora sp. NBC_00374 TaxID=2975964 RepID=UPI0030E4C9EF